MCVLSELRLSYVINSIAADVLTTQGARSTAAMVLAGLSWNIPVSPAEGLIFIFIIFNAYGSLFCSCEQVAKPQLIANIDGYGP